MGKEFVEGWQLIQVLGEGTYGEVQLLLNVTTQEAVAVKQLNINQEPGAAKNICKEVFIHKKLHHQNIIKYFGHREEDPWHFIFLEYACGGELFDRIEPDIGMSTNIAHKYFCQILSGIDYMHSLGIAHRDLKPENILLDKDDNVKISDFGLATVFRHKGTERVLTKRCGTLPYLAPEVFYERYRAEPADVWSCGILLVTMLGGELPWNKATNKCIEYNSWKEGKYSITPWTKIGTLALALLKKILCHSPSKRYGIPEIREHLWFKKSGDCKSIKKLNVEGIPCKRLCSELDNSGQEKEDSVSKVSYSQPTPVLKGQDSDHIGILADVSNFAGMSFTQPLNPENMILSSQGATSAGMSQSPLQSLVRRMTRFCVKMKSEEAAKELIDAFEKLGYGWKKSGPGLVTITTLDKRKTQLIFKASLIEMRNRILIDFRLSKGDGLEFKRHFIKIKEIMAEVIDKQPIVTGLHKICH